MFIFYAYIAARIRNHKRQSWAVPFDCSFTNKPWVSPKYIAGIPSPWKSFVISNLATNKVAWDGAVYALRSSFVSHNLASSG